MEKVVRLTEGKLMNLIKEAIIEAIQINSKMPLHLQKMQLDELYETYLDRIQEKYGKSIQELEQTTNIHILTWKEFVKKHGSKELYQYIFR